MQRIAELFGLEVNSDLQIALTHESVMTRKASKKKYGTCQNILAAKGDARLKAIIVDYVHEQGLDHFQQQQFEKNQSMQSWAEHLGIRELFIIKKSKLKNETETHAVGTFVEALIELVYQKYGLEVTTAFVRQNYLRFVHDTIINTPTKANHIVNPDIDSLAFKKLKEKVSALYSRKVTLVQKSHENKGSCFRLSFHYGHGIDTKPVAFQSSYKQGLQSLEEICEEALCFLQQSQLSVA